MKTYCPKCKKYTTIIIKIMVNAEYSANEYDTNDHLCWSDLHNIEIIKTTYVCEKCGYKTKNEKKYKEKK